MGIMVIQGAEERAARIHYEVDPESTPLGVGGMGQVYRGVRVDENNGVRTEVAIKFLFDDLSENAIERARREASIRIHNDNLVEMFGFITLETPLEGGRVARHYHVVSELLDGTMLFDVLAGKSADGKGHEVEYARKLINESERDRAAFAVGIVTKVLAGIMALHDAGYIHRDLDPSNIFVTRDGRIKIIDFGIAKQLNDLGTQDRHLTTAGQFMGKAAYAAPELVVGDVVHQNATTDIYAIGILLYQLLTGKVPFDGPTAEVLEKQLKAKMPVKDIQNTALRKIVEKATAKKQGDRYQSASEMRVALESAARSLAPGRTASGVQTGLKPAPKSLPIQKIAIGAGALVVLLGVIFGVMGIVTDSKDAPVDQEEQQTAQVQAIEDKQKSDAATYKAGATVTAANAESAVKYVQQSGLPFDQSMAILNQAIDQKGRAGAQAAWLAGRLYGRDSNSGMTEASFPAEANQAKAYEMNTMALQLDPTNYKALYEQAQAYHGGEARTGGLLARDMAQAEKYYRQALEEATKADDLTYVNKINIQLKNFGPAAASGAQEAE